MAGGVSSPVIISISVAAVLLLSVALIAIVRWARTKPSRELPPPRPAFLSPYWANQQRYSTHVRGGSDFYDEERKLTAHGSGVFKPFGDAASNVSDTSLYRGTKTPYADGGDRSPNSAFSLGNDNLSGSPSTTPQLQPTELGEVSLNSPNPPRQRPTSIQFVDGNPLVRPAGSSGSLPPHGPSSAATGGDTNQAAATDPQSSHPAPPSSFHHHHPSPPRPFSSMSRSRHSFAGPSQPPPSIHSTKQDRRASRMSLYSTYSSSHYPDPRRSSVGSFRGPPHKTNMQIVLPQPLAPAAGNNSNGSFEAEESLRRERRRHSRVDLWTETNNVARTRSPLPGSSADNTVGSANRRNRRPSQGSERSSRSLELARSGQQQHFTHMEPPPPLPAASSSFLTSSRSATPTSSFSALPSSSAVTTPRTGSSSELSHDKADGPADDAKKPRNDALDNQIPSVPPLETAKDN